MIFCLLQSLRSIFEAWRHAQNFVETEWCRYYCLLDVLICHRHLQKCFVKVNDREHLTVDHLKQIFDDRERMTIQLGVSVHQTAVARDSTRFSDHVEWTGPLAVRETNNTISRRLLKPCLAASSRSSARLRESWLPSCNDFVLDWLVSH